MNVHTPTYMRAPGEASGVFALESAMDELAVALNIDPVELRLRNEPEQRRVQEAAVLEPLDAGMLPGSPPSASAGAGATPSRARCATAAG